MLGLLSLCAALLEPLILAFKVFFFLSPPSSGSVNNNKKITETKG